MSYEDWRTRSIRNVSTALVEAFAESYRPGTPTVVLLPGGMGSQLDRSFDTYRSGQMPPAAYDTVWADIGTLLAQQALTLEIESSGRDRDDRVIVANGPLKFLIKAYDATERFFGDPSVDVNYTVFGYDWRRPLAESAAFLVDFLKLLRVRVQEEKNEDPLPHLTLLAHSQGGLVAKILLHMDHGGETLFKRLITVATPFYGTWSHQRRYFIGEPALKMIYPARRMAPIIATLPGPYDLMFLPKALFERDGAALELNRYPMRDPGGGDGADPYDSASLGRYPTWLDRQHLHEAGRIYRTLAEPIPADFLPHVYNVRSIVDDETPVELVWDTLPPNFDPDRDDSPVNPITWGLGDGTVPGWSAWHASVPQDNQIELQESEDHAFLMEDPQVLGIVQALINDQPWREAEPSPGAAPPPAPAAPASAVEQLREGIAAGQVKEDDPRLNDPSMWRGLFRELMR